MTDPVFNELTVRFYSTSVKMASNLEYKGIFDSNASASARALFVEAFLATDAMDPAFKVVDGKEVVVYHVGKAVGFQLSLDVAEWDSNMSLSLAAVAARTQFSGSTATYHLQVLGLPKSIEDDFIHALGGATGAFTESTYSELQEMVSVKLPRYLRRTVVEPDAPPGPDQRPPLAVSDIKVPIAPDDPFDISRAVNLAVTHVSRGDNLETAKKEMKVNANTAAGVAAQDALHVIYKRIAGISADRVNDYPSPEAKAKAQRWLKFEEKSL